MLEVPKDEQKPHYLPPSIPLLQIKDPVKGKGVASPEALIEMPLGL